MTSRGDKTNRIFSNSISQRNSESEESLHLNSNGNVNDCNLLLDKRRNVETSIFDDSSIATVSAVQVWGVCGELSRVFSCELHHTRDDSKKQHNYL